jgi:hypothetical protein
MDRNILMDKIRDAFETSSEDVKCVECDSLHFVARIRLRRLSPITSPTGQEIILPQEIYVCSKCGTSLPEA